MQRACDLERTKSHGFWITPAAAAGQWFGSIACDLHANVCKSRSLYPEREDHCTLPQVRAVGRRNICTPRRRSQQETHACVYIVTQILCIVESAGDGINSLFFPHYVLRFIIQFCQRCNRRIACALNAISDARCHIAYPHESVDWVANWARTARADQKRDQDHLEE